MGTPEPMPSSSLRPNRRAAALMLALALFGTGAAACGGDAARETPVADDEPATEDNVDDDLVPGDPGNGQNTDPGDQAPGAQLGGDGSDEEDGP